MGILAQVCPHLEAPGGVASRQDEITDLVGTTYAQYVQVIEFALCWT